MKALSLDTILPTTIKEPVTTLKPEPVTVSADSSRPMRPLEIKRYVRSMRQNRQFNFSCDFLY